MELKTELATYLTSGSSVAIAKVERELSFESILTMKGIFKFGNLPKEKEKEVLKNINMLSDRFFKVNFPDANTAEVAAQFAIDVLDTRKDWTMYDVIYFFKFIRQRQDLEEMKIYGNAFKITPIILNRLVSIYEEHKSYAMDQLRNPRFVYQKTNQLPEATEALNIEIKEKPRDNRFRELHTILEQKLDERTDFMAKAALTKRFHQENEFCLKWLQTADITSDQKKQWYLDFFKRKLK